MKIFSLVFSSLLVMFFSCTDESVVPKKSEPIETCESFFFHSVFYEKNKTGKDSELVYRVTCPKNQKAASFAVFENAVWMKEKKYYLDEFKVDSLTGNLFFDFKYGSHWLSADEIRFYDKYFPAENEKPLQTLVLGNNFAINSCGTKWEISFPKTRNYVFELLNGDKFPYEAVREENGTIIFEIQKGGKIKKGDYIRGIFSWNKCPIDILMFP